MTEPTDDELPGLPPLLVNRVAPSPELLVEAARRGNRRSAFCVLDHIVEALSRDPSVPPAFAEYLEDAVAAMRSDPNNASTALGIGRGRGAPPRTVGLRRYAGAAVFRYRQAGVPYKDGRATPNWDGNGAVTRAILECAADGIEVSEDQAVEGYREHKRRRAWLQSKKAAAKADLDAMFNELEQSGDELD